ncbi:hypothetical protein [Rhizobium sp. AN80A]|uniref:hypothetical protein n=1 Tax=Rhizobium sp. AN80A TaxID=3040673 RepID=UPI0024B38498|nr:hypothetical protein [Rhizobium sp. AN80A]
MKTDIETLLPAEIVRRASLRGNEYAWPLDDIPLVIDAARQANLWNVGGQLQFRLPDGAVCECYWVEVTTYRTVAKAPEWPERVRGSASDALEQFSKLFEEFDFLAEGLKAFPDHLGPLIDQGHDWRKLACFVWYVKKQSK